MLKIRLKKYGRKNQPCYRIVAMDSRTKRDGRSIEELGFYNPITKETKLKVEEIITRLNQGAQITSTVHNILLKNNVFENIK
jgi:small subunit ribosomal protein S16